jgi:DNA-binding NarL/FixJ family response regulator
LREENFCGVFPTEIRAWQWNDLSMERSILVVDDDPAFRELAGRLLADAGLTVAAQANSADEAMRAANETKPEAVLVDVDLPDRNGIKLAGELTALPWRPRVVLTSVDPDAAGPDDVRRSGALAFLSKDQLANGTLLSLLGFE